MRNEPDKGRTIRKVMGGVEKKPPQKIMQGEMPGKIIRVRKKVKKKIQAEGTYNRNFHLTYILPVSIKNNSYSKYSWSLTPGTALS